MHLNSSITEPTVNTDSLRLFLTLIFLPFHMYVMHITFRKVNFNNMKSVLVAVLFEAAAARAVRNVQCVCVSLYVSVCVCVYLLDPDHLSLSLTCCAALC